VARAVTEEEPGAGHVKTWARKFVLRGEITDSIPRFYNSIEKRSLKSCGFTVNRF